MNKEKILDYIPNILCLAVFIFFFGPPFIALSFMVYKAWEAIISKAIQMMS